jgi:hypothetical protein
MSAPKPNKVGRPTLPKGNARDVMLRVRITPKELKAFESAASATDQTVSEWIRKTLNATIEA